MFLQPFFILHLLHAKAFGCLLLHGSMGAILLNIMCGWRACSEHYLHRYRIFPFPVLPTLVPAASINWITLSCSHLHGGNLSNILAASIDGTFNSPNTFASHLSIPLDYLADKQPTQYPNVYGLYSCFYIWYMNTCCAYTQKLFLEPTAVL